MSEDKAGRFQSRDVAILNFPNIFTPRAFKGKNGVAQGEPKFDAALELAPDSPDLKNMKAAAVAVARAKWPDRDLKVDFQFPWTLGDKLADKAKAKGKDRESSRGLVVLTARSQYAPRLSVIEKGDVVDYFDERRPLAKDAFYSGVKVGFVVTFNAYEGVGSNPDGVNAYLDWLISTKSGKRLVTSASGADVFKGYAGRVSDEDPTTADAGDDEF